MAEVTALELPRFKGKAGWEFTDLGELDLPDLQARCAQLTVGDIEVAFRIIERRLPDEAFFPQRLVAVKLLARLQLHAPSLDDVFLAKTGRSLEGAEDEVGVEETEEETVSAA